MQSASGDLVIAGWRGRTEATDENYIRRDKLPGNLPLDLRQSVNKRRVLGAGEAVAQDGVDHGQFAAEHGG